MRVAYTVLSPFISGAERSLQTMLRYLPQVSVEPVVLCPPDSRMIPWCRSNRILFDTCTLAQRDRWHPVRWWSSVRRMRSLLRLHKIDLVHSNQLWSYPATGAAAYTLGLPRVCHIRDEVSAEGLRWWLVSGVEAVLCISRYIEKQVSAAWSLEREKPWIGTLLNPVKLPELPPENEQRQTKRVARQHFGVAEDIPVFGFIGQIVPVKGLIQLLEALSGLVSDAKWALLVAGRDPRPGALHEKFCHQEVIRLGLSERVKFLGFLDDVQPFYQAIDLAVVPSLAEPLGRIPLEAASYAKPCIAFAAGGLSETIKHGETGWLVPVKDVECLCDALRDFLDHPSCEAGLAARKYVEKISDPRCYIQNLADIYAHLTSSNHPSSVREQRSYALTSGGKAPWLKFVC